MYKRIRDIITQYMRYNVPFSFKTQFSRRRSLKIINYVTFLDEESHIKMILFRKVYCLLSLFKDMEIHRLLY